MSDPRTAPKPSRTSSSSSANRIDVFDPLDMQIDELEESDLPLANHFEQVRRRQKGETGTHAGTDSSASRARTIDSTRSKEST